MPTLFINHFKNSLAGRSAAGDGINVWELLLLMVFVFSSYEILQIFERKIFWLVRHSEKNAPLITSVHKMGWKPGCEAIEDSHLTLTPTCFECSDTLESPVFFLSKFLFRWKYFQFHLLCENLTAQSGFVHKCMTQWLIIFPTCLFLSCKWLYFWCLACWLFEITFYSVLVIQDLFDMVSCELVVDVIFSAFLCVSV